MPRKKAPKKSKAERQKTWWEMDRDDPDYPTDEELEDLPTPPYVIQLLGFDPDDEDWG